MSTPNGPVRHDIMFSMSAASFDRVSLLLSQCGHTNLNLLLARGLALAQWVEDQTDRGLTIAAVSFGTDGVEQVVELQERAELLKPQARPQELPTAVRQVAPAAEAAPVPKPEPLPAVEPAPNPKLVPRQKKPPVAAATTRQRAPNRRVTQLAAHIPNDDGPVKTFEWVRWRCEQDKRAAPILIGGDRPLPGELGLEHLEQLERFLTYGRHVTHFKLATDGFISLYSFVPGKGWCYVDECSLQCHKDDHAAGGLFAIFPIVMAVEYLHRLSSSPANSARA